MTLFLPFAQRVTSRSEIFQLRFAHAAAEYLTASDVFGWRCDGEGLELLGETEDDLAAAAARLFIEYGDDLEMHDVRARYRSTPMFLEPVMHVAVSTPDAYGQRVLGVLHTRCVDVAFQENLRSTARFAGEAPAARVIGLRDNIRLVTDGTATMRMHLLGYFTPPPSPGGDAA